MILPKAYMRLSPSERLAIMQDISNAFKKLDKFSCPTIYQNIQNDETRYSIIERLINEMFARSKKPNLTQLLNTMEISLSE